MREEAFRVFLAHRLGGASVVASYLSNARRVERTLLADLDTLVLDPATIAALRSRLITAGLSATKASDCGSALPQCAAMADERATGPQVSPATTNAKTEPRNPAVTGADTPGLMRLYGDLLAELADRGIARTANAPVGDYAEHLFATAFGWSRAANSDMRFDAQDAAGHRYQIKGRRLPRSGAARQLGAIRDPAAGFDTLALVLFDTGMDILAAALVPRAVVAARATFVAYITSWRMMAPRRLWNLPGVVDATADLRAAAAR